MAGTAGADFVFNIIQRTPGDRFEVGSTVVFDVTLARADGFPSVNNLAGLSFFVGLGDPAGWGGTHPAEHLVPVPTIAPIHWPAGDSICSVPAKVGF